MPASAFEVAVTMGALLAVCASAALLGREPFDAPQPPGASTSDGSPPRTVPSVRSAVCARLSPGAPEELREACARGVLRGSGEGGGQGPGLSLHGVAACVTGCLPRDSCGLIVPACADASSASTPYRCELTHYETRTRDGSPPAAPERAAYRVFVVAAPGCLVKPAEADGKTFRDDANSLRLMMTFPEKLLVGYASSVEVPFPDSWTVRMTGSRGWRPEDTGTFALPASVPLDPSPEAATLPAMSVYKTSTFGAEKGQRPASPGRLAKILHSASAREPPRSDGLPSESLFSAQPLRVTFTVACEAGDSGVGSVTVRTLAPDRRQEGGIVTDEAFKRVRSEIVDGTRELPGGQGGISWTVTGRGRGAAAAEAAASPLTGQPVPPGSTVWLCLSVDTWTGQIADCREVVFVPGSVSVSRRRDTGVFVDLSAETPVEVSGVGGVALGIGSAVRYFFGSRKAL